LSTSTHHEQPHILHSSVTPSGSLHIRTTIKARYVSAAKADEAAVGGLDSVFLHKVEGSDGSDSEGVGEGGDGDAAKQVDMKFFMGKGGADEVPVGKEEDQEMAVALAEGLAEMESEDGLGEEDEKDPDVEDQMEECAKD
jgi:hypothetical protein